jgi:hypothetical protein
VWCIIYAPAEPQHCVIGDKEWRRGEGGQGMARTES